MVTDLFFPLIWPQVCIPMLRMKRSRECKRPIKSFFPSPSSKVMDSAYLFLLKLCCRSIDWMYTPVPCVMEIFNLSCESAILKKEQLSVLLFAAVARSLFLVPCSDVTLTLAPAASNNLLRRGAKKEKHIPDADWLPVGEMILCIGRRVSLLTDVCVYLQVCAYVHVCAAALMIAVATLLLWEDRAALTMTEIQVSWAHALMVQCAIMTCMKCSLVWIH